MLHSDKLRIKIKGTWWDEFHRRDEHGRLVLVERTPPMSNDQMDVSLILMSGLLKNEGTFTGGILYQAQGLGDSAWSTPPAVVTSDTTLVNEHERRAPDSIVYLDGSDVPTLTKTAKLLVSTVYGESELVGVTIREQALFGGDATGTTDSGQILNQIKHTPRFKSAGLTWTRKIKLELS